MLNKIWAGLIIISILFALGQDIYDEVYNIHQNGIPQTIPYSSSPTSNSQITLFFAQQEIYAQLIPDRLIRLQLNEHSPQRLLQIASANGKDKQLTATVISRNTEQIQLLFPDLHWVKMRAITQSAFDMAEFAAKLALGLIGIMALWLGLMRISEKSGLINIMVKLVQPLLRWLFPGIPKDHPAFASISMNMAANILGLGNAATPLGIKAMQQLQSLNQKRDSASDEMCMFLALNTSSVQLLPPVTLIALMGTQTSELIIPIILATSCSTITAITVAKLYARRGLKNATAD